MAQQSKIKPTKDQNKEIENLRDSNKLKNNKKQIEWRRNKFASFYYEETLNLKYLEL